MIRSAGNSRRLKVPYGRTSEGFLPYLPSRYKLYLRNGDRDERAIERFHRR